MYNNCFKSTPPTLNMFSAILQRSLSLFGSSLALSLFSFLLAAAFTQLWGLECLHACMAHLLLAIMPAPMRESELGLSY